MIDPNFRPVVRLGTRGSALARHQTELVAKRLRAAWPGLQTGLLVISTKGDRVLDSPLPLIGGKGLFTQELEESLLQGRIDFAVHSLKDLPTEMPPGLTVGAILERADPRDALVCRGDFTLESLPQGATVGTSSRRRAGQLLHLRPDLRILDIRGNVETRIRKVMDPEGPYQATVLALAGLERLGLTEVISQVLPLDGMLPAPGQGALAVQCRDDAPSQELLAAIHDPATGAAVSGERAFLAGLGGGCAVPVAAHGWLEGETLHLRGRVSALDGKRRIDVAIQGDPRNAQALGQALAEMALAQGAAEILGREAAE